MSDDGDYIQPDTNSAACWSPRLMTSSSGPRLYRLYDLPCFLVQPRIPPELRA